MSTGEPAKFSRDEITMSPELEVYLDSRIDMMVSGFRDMAKEQLVDYAKSVAMMGGCKELEQRDIDFSMSALAMCVKEEVEERKSNAIAIDPT